MGTAVPLLADMNSASTLRHGFDLISFDLITQEKIAKETTR